MKILLDECVTKKLRAYLPAHEVYTVVDKGWSGLYNGKLMTKCVEDGIDILITIDKNILYQQSVSKYSLTVVVFDALNSKVNTLANFLPQFENEVNTYQKGKLYTLTISNSRNT